MKKYLLAILAVVAVNTCIAQTIDASKLSEYDKNTPVGFGASVTGVRAVRRLPWRTSRN